MTETKKQPLIEVKNLKKYFPLSKGGWGRKKKFIKAVDDVNFCIYRGETLGLVGESGCGKSTTGRTITRLYNPTEGNIFFDGIDIGSMNDKELKPFRKRMQIIFQDPFASLNPHMTISKILMEPLNIYNNLTNKEKKEMIYDLLDKVGLSKEHADRHPHEFSGGQRQRIGIARALSTKPDFVLCDEPISALDVSIQAQIVNMLEDLQKEYGLTYLFIAHDLSMVRHISDRIGVMYLGKLVEIAPSEQLYRGALHPYTKALLSAIPIPDPDAAAFKQRQLLSGDVPSPLNPPSGCRFRTRCKYALPKCSEVEPKMIEIEKGHMTACHLYDK